MSSEKTPKQKCAVCGNLFTECNCDQLVCPFHGKTRARKAQIDKDGKKVDGFKCSVEGCEISRSSNEIEFPFTKGSK